LSGEFTVLHSIHGLANLALKETVPPECEKYTEYSEKFQGKLCISL